VVAAWDRDEYPVPRFEPFHRDKLEFAFERVPSNFEEFPDDVMATVPLPFMRPVDAFHFKLRT